MDFIDFIGQKEVVKGLKDSIIKDKVGHAYIFCGPKGIGKNTLSQIFSGSLLCSNVKNGERCGECTSCMLFNNLSHPDLNIISQGDESIGVEEIRKLQSNIIIKPLYGKKKVYIINNAENMTIQAQNCLLKILEEPPVYAVIMLLTSNHSSLLETIRSRAVKISFRKNTYSEVREYILKLENISNDTIDFIISYCDGIIGNAVNLINSRDFVTLRDKTTEIIIKLLNNDLSDIFDIYDFFEENKQRIDILFDIMLLFYRDLLIVKKTGNQNILINSDKKDIILSNVSRYTVPKLLENIEIIELTRKNINQNANYQLSIEVMLMKLQEESFNGKGGWSKV